MFSFILLVFADQLGKYLIRHFGGFYICNPNISFGIYVPTFLFFALWFAIILIVLYYLYRSQRNLFLIFILAGAVSNLIDRISLGCVIDFIDLKFWPIFNLADAFIVIGVIMLILQIKKQK